MNNLRWATFLMLLSISFLYNSCAKDELNNPLDGSLSGTMKNCAPDGQQSYFILPDSKDFANIPQDPKNPITEEKIALGNLLFFETGLALAPIHAIGEQSFSCGSCHVLSARSRLSSPFPAAVIWSAPLVAVAMFFHLDVLCHRRSQLL